jgi:DNA-binding beta-propeller fold protein YncE
MTRALLLLAALAAGCGSGSPAIGGTEAEAKASSPLLKVYFNVGKAPEGMTVNLATHRVFIETDLEDGDVEPPGDDESGEESGGEAEPYTVVDIDPVTGISYAQITVHSEGEYLAANPATNLVYHANMRTSEVAVIDGATDTVVGYVSLVFSDGAWQPEGIAVDVAQNLIYVGAKAPPLEWEEEGTKPPGCEMIPDPLEEHGVECWNPGRIFVIDGETNQLARAADFTPLSFLAGDDPEAIVFAAATNKVYAANEDDGTITVGQGAVRTAAGITAPYVLSTISGGVAVPGWVRPACDAELNCVPLEPLWPSASACAGWDKAQEADKMAVDPAGNVYITDDKYRVAKIDHATDSVASVLGLGGYACPDPVTGLLGANTANNIVISVAGDKVRLYVISEQNTISLIDPRTMTLTSTITIPGAVHLDAVAADGGINRLYVTDEEVPALYVLQGRCANGVSLACE